MAPTTSNDHPAPEAKKLLKVVVKKTNTSSSARRRGKANLQQKQLPGSRKRGLPSFHKKVDKETVQKTFLKKDGDDDLDQDDQDPFQQNDDDQFFANLVCDTLLAIRTLHQQRNNPDPMPSCLEIPVDDGSSIQGVLECQLHEFFTTGAGKGGSSPVVSQELDQLLRNNTLCRLSNTITTNVAPITVYILTEDYQRAARAAAEEGSQAEHAKIFLEWFLQNLHQWTGRRISRTALQETWRQNPPPKHSLDHNNNNINSENAIRWLQDQQLLHAAALDHTEYQLWLPAWGRQVVPAMLQARTEALAFLQQSRSKERSVSSVVQRLRRHPVPVCAVLIPWWVEQGWVRRVTRPAGPALQFVEK